MDRNPAVPQVRVRRRESRVQHQNANTSKQHDFDSLYVREVGFVWRALRGMGVPDSTIDDAVQEVFVVVHRRLREFGGRSSIRTWLFAIAYRTACHYRRDMRRMRKSEPLESSLPDCAPSPHESAERAQGVRMVAEMLRSFDENKRVAIVLSEIVGMTVPEIAECTGVGVNTAYTRLRRARQQFNRMVAAYQQERAGTPGSSIERRS